MFPRRISVFLALMLCVVGSAGEIVYSSSAAAQMVAQNPARPNRRPGKGNFLRELNLTPQQMQKMQAVREQYKGQIRQQNQALRQAQQTLQNLMAGTASKEQVRSQYRQVAALRQQLAELNFNSILEIREVLTPEQRRKFADLMQRRQGQQNPVGAPPEPGL